MQLLDNASTGVPFSKHDRHTITGFLTGLRATHGPNSVKGTAGCLRTFFNWLYEDTALPRSFLKAFRVSGQTPERLLVAEADFDALLSAGADDGPAHALRTLRDQAIIHVLRETGVRAAELVSLNHGSVEPDPKGGLWLRMPRTAKRLKTGPRDVLVTRSVGALNAWIAALPGTADDPVFRSLSDRSHGRRLWPNEIGRVVTRLRREAGLEK